MHQGGPEQQSGVHRQEAAKRRELLEAGPPLHEERRAGEERTERVPDVLRGAVPGEAHGAPGLAGHPGQDGLLEDQRRAPIPAHPVEHPHEGGGREDVDPQGGGGDEGPCGADAGEDDERLPSTEAIAGDGDDEGSEGCSREPETHHQADLRGGKTEPRQIDAEQHADQARADGAKERGGEEEVPISRHGEPRSGGRAP